ncbi:MAG: hypothetical protein AMXMBFR53_21540 [Gemmatimonadota bacterium]
MSVAPGVTPRPRAVRVLITCEHGGHQVPDEYRAWFAGAGEVLASHRGWDAGALALAGVLGGALGAPVRSATVTRLLVDLNRSPHNPRVFSEFTRGAPPEEKARVLAEWHAPYREGVDAAVAERVTSGRTVLHLGIHSFAPSWNGAPRRPDVALLYDPARPSERTLCARWAEALKAALPGYRVHRNDPYRGAADGLTTWLRRRHPQDRYLGIEVEVNQRHLDASGRFPEAVARALGEGLGEALGALGWPAPRLAPY